ncbi:MAG TPA: NDP-sugar synthase [Actinomycetota bacterium]|nr:NDP-sugar synthase [Actinomycetota bacterium]
MKALILAGGLGTRLRPLTYTRPKPLLPIAGRPHIDHVLDLLHRHGITEVVLTTSYLADAFHETSAAAVARGMDVEVMRETRPLGTAGAIKNAVELVADETFLAFNGDVLTDVDLNELIASHRGSEAVASILLAPVDDPSAYGIVPTDDSGRVTGFIEKPTPEEATTNMINAGVYVLEPEVLDRIPAGIPASIERETFPALVETGRVYAFGTDGYWMDVGTPHAYLAANLDALAGRIALEVSGTRRDDSLIGEGAEIHTTAQIHSSYIGAGSRIEEGAVLRSCVLFPNVVIGMGASLQRYIVGEGAHIPPKTDGADAIIEDGMRGLREGD